MVNESIISDGYKSYVLSCVNEFYSQNGRLPKKEELKSNATLIPFVQDCGGWKKALQSLGFESVSEKAIDSVQQNNKETNNTTSVTDVLTTLKQHISENESVPTMAFIKEQNLNIKPLIKKYGSWNEVKKLLKGELVTIKIGEYKKNKENDTKIKTKQLAKEIVKYCRDYNKIPTVRELKNMKISYNNIIKFFGSHKDMVEKLKLKDYIDDSRQMVMNSLNDSEEYVERKSTIKEKLTKLTLTNNRLPKISDLASVDLKKYDIEKCYCSWKNAIKETGMLSVLNNKIKEDVLKLENDLAHIPNKKELKMAGIIIKPLIKEYDTWKKACVELGLEENLKTIIKNKITSLAETINKTPHLYDIKEHHINYRKTDMKWRELAKELDLDNYDERNVATEITTLVDILDRTPTILEMKENSVKIGRFAKKYGGWSKFREKIGLYKRSKYTNTQIKEIENSIIALSNIDGATPKLKDIVSNKIKYNCLVSRYGSWNNALEKLGLKLNNKYSDMDINEIMSKIQALYEDTGKAPTMKELKEKGIPYSPLVRKYGSLNSCLLEMGITPRLLSSKSFDKEIILDKIRTLTEKLGKKPSIKIAKENGIKVCSLIKECGSWSNVKSLLDESISEPELQQVG